VALICRTFLKKKKQKKKERKEKEKEEEERKEKDYTKYCILKLTSVKKKKLTSIHPHQVCTWLKNIIK
jgi:hypothetical protein